MATGPRRGLRLDATSVLAILAVGLVLGAVVAHTVGLGGVQQYSTVTATSTEILAPSQSTQTEAFATFQFESGMPSNFTLGSYFFQLTCDGNGCPTVQGSTTLVNLGYEVNFEVTSGAESQEISFGWTPAGPAEPNPLPNPSSETAFGGAVTMTWYTNSTELSGLYLTVDVQP